MTKFRLREVELQTLLIITNIYKDISTKQDCSTAWPFTALKDAICKKKILNCSNNDASGLLAAIPKWLRVLLFDDLVTRLENQLFFHFFYALMYKKDLC